MCPNGRTARFECQVEGTPTPQIYWLKDAENITITGKAKLNNLQIPNKWVNKI